MTKVSKFVAELAKSNSALKLQRAKLLGEKAKDAQEALIAELKRKMNALNSKLMELQDLGVSHTTSLKFDSFNSENWAKEMQNTKIQIINLQVELDIANKTYSEWFADVEVESAD